jgi:hypothetical protein
MNRRQLLHGLAVSLPFFAGCNSLFESEDNTQQQTPTTTQSPPTTTTTTTTAPPTTTPTATTQSPTPTIQRATETATTTTPQTATTTPNGSQFDTLAPSQLTTYSNPTIGFSVLYPAGWTIKEGGSGADMVIVPPQGSAGIGISWTRPIKKGLTMSDGVSIYKQALRKARDNTTFVGKRSVTLPSGQDAIVLHAKISLSGTNSPVIHQTACLTIVNRSLYIVEFVALNPFYRANKRTIQKIVTSLTIK